MYLHTSDQRKMDLGFGNHSCHWGTHIAGLYETKEERDLILGGFLQKGIEDGDYLCYGIDDLDDQKIRQQIMERNPSLQKKMDDPGAVAHFSPKELYYPEGRFSPLSMDGGLNQMLKDAKNSTSGNIRATGDMSWALEENIPGLEHLMVYESRLNNFIENKPWVSVCLYDLNRFSGEVIMEVFRTHPFIINKGVITENPFYTRPDVWLKEKGYAQD